MSKEFTPDIENQIFALASNFVNQTSRHIFLTGKAGTGKTTFLKYISKHSHKNVVVAAPTGVAAINAGGVTAHSLFQLPFEPYIPNTKLKNTYAFGTNKLNLLREMELLIIDEVSMLRVDMLDAIDSTLRFARRNQMPFGGVQVLYIGDMFQLPPVVRDQEWEILKEHYAGPFFFHAKVMERVPLVYLELKKVYRQTEQVFIDLLNRVRNNELTTSDIALLNKQHQPNFADQSANKHIILTTHNNQADQINVQKLAELKAPSLVFEGIITGDFPDNSLPTDRRMELKVGAQIMFLKNDNETKQYFNGKLAEISRMDKDNIYAIPEGSKTEVKVPKEVWKNVRYELNKETNAIDEAVLGTFTQYPIRTAWAITVHKSQGLTFEHAVIDISRAFAAGQAYVALSRCTSLEGIVLLSPINQQCIQTDQHAVAFAKTEKPVDQLENILTTAKKEFWTNRLLNYFSWTHLLTLLMQYRTLTRDKVSEDLKHAHEMAETIFMVALGQEIVAKKFCSQLKDLLAKGEDIEVIKDRVSKAVTFFYNDIRTKILLPLQNHRSGFAKIKKAKSYWKSLNTLEEDVIRFTQNLTKVRYNDTPLTEGLVLEPLEMKSTINFDQQFDEHFAKPADKKEGKKTANIPPPQTAPKAKPLGKIKVLELFKKGQSVAEIAQNCNYATSTVESHLTDFVKSGLIDIKKLVTQDQINEILPLVPQAVEQGGNILTTLKDKLDPDYTYVTIKAVINHWKFLNDKE